MSKLSNDAINSENPRITQETLIYATDILCKKDNDLKKIVENYGYPPLWNRPANFSTLVQIILEQQVSLSSAQATFNKLKTVVSPVTADQFIKLSPIDLNGLGFTRQKSEYCLGLAQSVVNKELNLRKLTKFDSNSVHEVLVGIRGIGPWSADVYLLMALRHPDIWPQGDLALKTAICQVKRLRKKPTAERIVKVTSNWRPWRSVAARMLWHYYLSR